MRIGLDGIPLLTTKTGVGRYTAELATAINRLPDGPEVVFFYGNHWGRHRKGNGMHSDAPIYKNFKKRIFTLFSHDFKKWLRQQVFKGGARWYRLELFHATNYVSYPFQGPIVVTIHDLSHLRFPETHPTERLNWLHEGLPGTLQRAERIIAVSHFTKEEIISLFGVPEKKIVVIYEGASLRSVPKDGNVSAAMLKEFDIKPNGYILSVGTLEPRKNILSLIHAYELLPDSLKARFPLVVAGMCGWNSQAIYERMESLARKGRLRALGYVSDDQLPFIYAGAQLFIYPSLYEGFGLPPLEAMASGTPVLVSNRASLPEVVGNAGELVDPEDIESLAQAMESLLEDPKKRQQMAEMGLEQAKRFTWKECAEKTVQVYEDVLYTG